MNAGREHDKTRNIEERLLKWLGEEGFSAEELGGGNTVFNLWVTRNGVPSFSIFQPRDKQDAVYVESGVTFSGLEKEVFSVLVDHNNNLSWELKSLLLSKGFASFKIQLPDLRSNEPGGIIFAKTIYYDGLSKDRFLETTCQTLNTVRAIVLTIQRHVASQVANRSNKNHSLSYVT